MTLVSPSQSNSGDTIEASDINTPVNQLAAVVNGNIDSSNIAANGVGTTQLATGAVTTAKLADASVTNAKLATSTGEIGAAWQSWTPTLTSMTIGNGTVTAAYNLIGKTVNFRLKIVLGSTSSITGSVTMTLPVTANSYLASANDSYIIGHGWVSDASVTNYAAFAQANTANVMSIVVPQASSSYMQYTGISGSVPFAWGNTDSFTLHGSYEAA